MYTAKTRAHVEQFVRNTMRLYGAAGKIKNGRRYRMALIKSRDDLRRLIKSMLNYEQLLYSRADRAQVTEFRAHIEACEALMWDDVARHD